MIEPKIYQVAEVSGERTANDYLAAGWVLLAVAKMDVDSREYSAPVIKYALGWTSDDQPRRPSVY